MTKNKNELQEIMQRIGKYVRTQDNRATSDPLFIVQEKKRVYGVDSDHTDTHTWHDNDNDFVEADEQESQWLNDLEYNDGDTGTWVKCGYIDIWEFVTACFTEKGCQDYIDANRHNLTEPRIYAASMYRNREMIAIRETLLDWK